MRFYILRFFADNLGVVKNTLQKGLKLDWNSMELFKLNSNISLFSFGRIEAFILHLPTKATCGNSFTSRHLLSTKEYIFSARFHAPVEWVFTHLFTFFPFRHCCLCLLVFSLAPANIYGSVSQAVSPSGSHSPSLSIQSCTKGRLYGAWRCFF